MAKVYLIYFDINTGYYPSFHHGLAYLVGTLKSNGHDIFLSHLKNTNIYDELIHSLEKEKPEVIGLSFTTNQKKYVHHLFDKTSLSAKVIIAGGVHCTLVGEQIFHEFPNIHGICIGEGETAINELCIRLDRNDPYNSTPSFYFKTDDGVIKNNILDLKNIDSLSMPDYTLFDYNQIIKDNGMCFPMMLSRGCPFNCHYCCNHVFKENYPNKTNYVRFPSISRAIAVIKNNLRLFPKTEKVIFADDTFTLNKTWITEFCETYKREIGLPFLCNARVETINDDVVRLLKNAGCVSIDFGVESGNEWLRNNILNRRHSNEKIKEAFHITKKYGIKSFSFNIIGLPFETREMAQDTVKLNLELQPNFGKCFYFYPYPGSKLYQLCLEYELLKENYDSVSGYLESPSVKEIFMSYSDIKNFSDKMQIFFYGRLIFSKIKLPVLIENFLIKILFLIKKPVLSFLNPNINNNIVLQARKVMRKIAMIYLR